MKEPMKRANYFMPEELLTRLEAEYKLSGVPRSEIVRRAVDGWLRMLDYNRKKQN